MLDICTDKVWAMCYKWKDATIFDANENYHSAEGLIQRPPKNQHEKKIMQQASPFCWSFNAATQKW